MRKNHSRQMLFFVAVLLFTGKIHAFTCVSDGGIIPQGGSSEPVPVRIHVDPKLSSGKNQMVDVSSVICKNNADDRGWVDMLFIDSVDVVKSDLFDVTKGVTVNGRDYDIKGSGYKFNDLNNQLLKLGGGGMGQVPMEMYIKLSKKPSRDIVIKEGEILVRMNMLQINNQPGCPLCGSYKWNLVANNDAYFATTSCTINGAKQMNVDFGPISQDNFTTSVDRAVIKQNQNLDYYCEGSNASQDIAVRLVGNTSGFSSEAIQTSNSNIGIAMLYKGNLIKPNEIFNSKIVNGMGSDTLTFVPIKKNVPFNEINTGPFFGSATLVFSVP
ncbi:fimbrial protein [Serratia marcescens]|uniref:fimbrial protein n=1 Tax=Serratia marcescens TaxID=615 RepID=UPI002FD8C561